MFKWSATNYDSHENHGAATTFVSMHMLGALCQIVLHREHLPFIPLRCGRPAGPLGDSIYGAEAAPHAFWEDSTAEIFRAASVVESLVGICRDRLPLSSIVLFTVWISCFMGVYAAHFPHMDVHGYMLPEANQPSKRKSKDFELRN